MGEALSGETYHGLASCSAAKVTRIYKEEESAEPRNRGSPYLYT